VDLLAQRAPSGRLRAQGRPARAAGTGDADGVAGGLADAAAARLRRGDLGAHRRGTFEKFLGGVHRLEAVGFTLERSPEEAWPHFKGWRVNYEAVAYAIADRVVAVPGPWAGARTHLPGLQIVPRRPPDRRPTELPGRSAAGPEGLG
jgi:hypothetical protein